MCIIIIIIIIIIIFIYYNKLYIYVSFSLKFSWYKNLLSFLNLYFLGWL